MKVNKDEYRVDILPNSKSDRMERGMSFVKVTHIKSGISATSCCINQTMALEVAINKVRIIVYAWENEFKEEI